MLEGLKLRKKLGENWKKVDCEVVEAYGLRVIQGEKTRKFYMLKENELLNEPDGYRRALAYEVSRNKEYVVIATGTKVFVKYLGDGDMAEIIELRDMHSIYQIDNMAMLFEKNNNNQVYKVLDINKLQVKDIDLSCYFWINEMSVIELIEDGGYRYMYSQNNQLYTTDILEKNLEDEQGCQISKKKGEKGYRLYYLSPNLGILKVQKFGMKSEKYHIEKEKNIIHMIS